MNQVFYVKRGKIVTRFNNYASAWRFWSVWLGSIIIIPMTREGIQ